MSEPTKKKAIIEKQDADRQTAFMLAVQHGHLEIVKALLEKGAVQKVSPVSEEPTTEEEETLRDRYTM